jgi:methylmalonyl-CoA mutase N-terminal domain/subunit
METAHLLGFFFKSQEDDFSDVEEIRSLKEEWDHLCNQLRM